MTGFKPGSSVIGINCAVNCATTTARGTAMFVHEFKMQKSELVRRYHVSVDKRYHPKL